MKLESSISAKKSVTNTSDICEVIDLKADLFEQCLPEIRHIKLVSTHFHNL